MTTPCSETSLRLPSQCHHQPILSYDSENVPAGQTQPQEQQVGASVHTGFQPPLLPQLTPLTLHNPLKGPAVQGHNGLGLQAKGRGTRVTLVTDSQFPVRPFRSLTISEEGREQGSPPISLVSGSWEPAPRVCLAGQLFPAPHPRTPPFFSAWGWVEVSQGKALHRPQVTLILRGDLSGV